MTKKHWRIREFVLKQLEDGPLDTATLYHRIEEKTRYSTISMAELGCTLRCDLRVAAVGTMMVRDLWGHHPVTIWDRRS